MTPGRKLSMNTSASTTQMAHDLDAFWRFHVQRDAPFAEICRDGKGRMVFVTFADIARPVAAEGLYLDDIGTVLGQQHSHIGSGHALAQIDDFQALIRRLVTHRAFPFVR